MSELHEMNVKAMLAHADRTEHAVDVIKTEVTNIHTQIKQQNENIKTLEAKLNAILATIQTLK